MVQVARVVADLVDHRRDVGGQAIVLLEIAGEIGLGPLADLGQGLGVGLGIDRHANDVGPGLDQVLDLGDRRVDVGRLRGTHALNGDGIAGADRKGANLDRAGGIARGLRHRAYLFPMRVLDFNPLFYAIGEPSSENAVISGTVDRAACIALKVCGEPLFYAIVARKHPVPRNR